VSVANANEKEAAVWYSQTIGSTKIAAALGYTDNQDTGSTDRTRTAISGSAILKNGLNFTLSYSTQDNKTASVTSSNTYFKVGWKKGKNAVSLSYGQQEWDGGSLDGTNPSSMAVSYNYTIAKSVEAYASVRVSGADQSGLDDVTGLWIGSRIKWK
jgi:hypothetical protein